MRGFGGDFGLLLLRRFLSLLSQVGGKSIDDGDRRTKRW